VGFITKLKVGEVEIAADQTCKDPTNPTKDLKVVAVLNNALWQTGITDAVYASGQISTANKQKVALLTLSDLVNIDVVFQFAVYEYDPLAKKYFLAFHSNSKDMNGLLEKSGVNLNVNVADDASTEVQSPENYAFQLGIKPKPSSQAMHLATGDQKNVVKAWGLAVA
jgi:hypothetical protein